jgi:hypothetical protein
LSTALPLDAAPPVDTPSIPADASQPALDLTGLLANRRESQNWPGYVATDGGNTAVSATWNAPDVVQSLSAGVDGFWVGIGGVRSRDPIQAGTQRAVSNRGAIQP